MYPIYSIPVNTIRGFEIHCLRLSSRKKKIHCLRLRQLGLHCFWRHYIRRPSCCWQLTTTESYISSGSRFRSGVASFVARASLIATFLLQMNEAAYGAEVDFAEPDAAGEAERTGQSLTDNRQVADQSALLQVDRALGKSLGQRQSPLALHDSSQ